MKKPEVPGVGMRGGLGRTLLTAFLALAILPLSIVSWYAIDRSRLNIQEEVTRKLASIAALKEVQLSRWAEEQAAVLSAPDFRAQIQEAMREADAGAVKVRDRLATAARQGGVVDVALASPEGRVEWAGNEDWEGEMLSLPHASGPGVSGLVIQPSLDSGDQTELVMVTLFSPQSRWPYVAIRLSTAELNQILEETAGLGRTGRAYLVDRFGSSFPQAQQISGPGTQIAFTKEAYEGLYENDGGMPVIGVYRWLPALDLALFVEQSQEEAFAGNNAVAVAVIAATLSVALITAVLAAVVTRQITRPVVRLTESALRIARGDLTQRVEVTSRDEIGILADVFNRMASELEVLYEELEAKVAQRTELLQQANYQIQRRAIQMQASLEIGQAVTSVLDPDQLLERVVQVVKERFMYSCVAVYTAEDDGQYLRLRAAAGEPAPFHGQRVLVKRSGPVGRAFREGRAMVKSHNTSVTRNTPASYTRFEVILPLRLGNQTLGILDVQTTDEEGIDQDDVSVLQNVSNQVTIALENARAYAVERAAAERLRELDRSKRQFLANMSHELRTPLTNIIGFSRLMLKDIDGPLSEQQRNDLQIIYHNGQHLLGLINDLLDISQIEAGLMELEFREVNLAGLIRSVMTTISALVRDKDVVLREEVAADLPLVRADPARMRQVLLRLLANAAKFTKQGEIRVRAWADGEQAYVSVSDTGMGLSPEDKERIFERFEQVMLENGSRSNGAGLGLALSKEFIEMHGGKIWVESEVGQGTTFTFSLPLRPPSAEQA
ncbi:MAG: ATP-binding protein [Anaerolineae bacterium]|nr:ATP-binding protein [Anaerolineae bacterium]MDH7473528.1 ATP-binding protein [Anaerolineae bacterium]